MIPAVSKATGTNGEVNVLLILEINENNQN